jgi:hypothetical protein
MDNIKPIGFQLLGIRTDQFAIVEHEFDTNRPMAFSINFNIGKDDANNILSVLFSSRFNDEGRTIMILECSCHFKINEDSWNEFKDGDSTSLTIPKEFITHLAVITVGTARGILHGKTEGTKFNGHILPTLNLLDIFTENVTVE